MDKTILTIEEVADYLRVSERTVYDWAQKGEIPAGKIGTSWRFKRREIEKWVDERLGSRNHLADSHSVNLATLLSPDRVVFLKARLKRDALVELVEVLGKAPEITSLEDLKESIFRREELMSTGIGMGIAIPHVRISSVKDLVMAVGISKEGIEDYQALDGQLVQIIIMIAGREDQHAYYLKTLSYVSSKLKNEVIKTSIIEADSTNSAFNILAGKQD